MRNKGGSNVKRLIFLILFFFLAGCASQMDSNGESAKQYLLDQGYDIESYEGSQDYSFTRADLADMPHNSIWALQTADPEPYVGKEMVQEIFIVNDHPLSRIYGPQKGFSEKVEVRVLMYDGKVIGGTSFPVGMDLGGWGYSIDGKTVEEIQGENINQLIMKWKEQGGSY
jgi:hypothetical protein